MRNRGWLRRSTRFAVDERGSGVAEFAIIVLLLVMFIFAVIDVGRGFYTRNRLLFAAQEGARFAAVQADPVANAAAVRAVVEQIPIWYGSPAITDGQIAVSADPTLKRVTVSVTGYSFTLLSPFAKMIGQSSVTLGSQVIMPWNKGS